MYKMRILDAKQVRGLISMDDAIKGVREAYKLYSTGKAGLWPIITHDFKTGCSDMDIKSGYMEDAGIYGLKILGWNKDNTKLLGTPALAGLIVVMDIERQQPTGILEGTPVTSYRTGAAGAVAAQLLANPESEKAVIVGAGAQGRAQLLGLSKVMKNLKSVAVIDKTAEAAESMVKEVSTDYPQLTLSAQPFGSMEKFVREADIVVTCTPSRTPFIGKGWLKKGAHINTIGADAPGKQETDAELAASAKIFCDSRIQVSQKGECQHAVRLGLVKPEQITEIGEVIAGLKPGRTSKDEITMFDATGMAIQDLITAKLVLGRAEAAAVGTVIEMEQ